MSIKTPFVFFIVIAAAPPNDRSSRADSGIESVDITELLQVIHLPVSRSLRDADACQSQPIDFKGVVFAGLGEGAASPHVEKTGGPSA